MLPSFSLALCILGGHLLGDFRGKKQRGKISQNGLSLQSS
jgi:hypothetical protein